MLKKMTLLALSVAALAAFAVPAVASAQLKEGGTALSVGAEVTATSTNLETVATDLKTTFKCELVTLHLKVVANNAGAMQLSNVATTTAGCSSPITNPTAGTVFLGSGTGEAVATFVAAGICDFAGNIPLSYASGGSTLTVTGPQPQLNGNCGKGDMTGSFTLETNNGTPVAVS